jgi:hypothetical protein
MKVVLSCGGPSTMLRMVMSRCGLPPAARSHAGGMAAGSFPTKQGSAGRTR